MHERTTMFKNNSRGSGYSSGCGSLQYCKGLIGDSSAIGYYSYNQRCSQ